MAVVAALLLLSVSALGDWASTQSPRAVSVTPNDFWYWHKIGVTANGKSPPILPTDIEYDDDHTLFWHFGPNFANLERAWAISRCGTSDKPVIIANIDTEFMVSHYDMKANLWSNSAEVSGLPGVDDDGNGFVDDTYPPQFDSKTGSVFGSEPYQIADIPLDVATELHGTLCMSVACAETNNESWWKGRQYSDYIADLPLHQTGIPGMTWNAKVLPTYNVQSADCETFGDYLIELKRRGENIRIVTLSVAGAPSCGGASFVKKMNAENILVVGSAGNDNWDVGDVENGGAWLTVSGVDHEYHRSRWNYPTEKGACYRTGAYGKNVDVVAYAPNAGDAWFYSGGTGKYVYFSGPEQLMTLNRVFTGGFENWADVLATGSKEEIAMLGVPGFGDIQYGNSSARTKSSEGYYTTTMGTSGCAPQAGAMAALLVTKHPELTPYQMIGAIRRGAVSVDASNTANCCTGTEVACDPVNGLNDDDPCAGYLGAGRIDAYRMLTLWGTVPSDTTFSGDVYVSGDVLIKAGRTVTVSAGTRFHIAPDDITYLDPWNMENRYDMSGSTGDGNDYLPSQTNASKIQFRIEGTGRLVILGTVGDPVVFDSFVNDAQTASDWTGIDVVDGNSITHANGAESIQILHSTNGEF